MLQSLNNYVVKASNYLHTVESHGSEHGSVFIIHRSVDPYRECRRSGCLPVHRKEQHHYLCNYYLYIYYL